MNWSFPLFNRTKIPINSKHPGSFRAIRRHGEKHTGVDLYCDAGTTVYAVDDGVVTGFGAFTGTKALSPWWLDTDYLMIHSNNGYSVCYGEIELHKSIGLIGQRIYKGDPIGTVKRVIKPEHVNGPKPEGWMPSMLHLELYVGKVTEPVTIFNSNLLDPTFILINACSKKKYHINQRSLIHV